MSFPSPLPLQSVEHLTADIGVDDPCAAAVRGSRLPMVVADARRDGCPMIFVNEAFLELTGYARQEVLGRSPRMLQGAHTDPDAVLAMAAALREGRELGVEVLNYKKSGEPFWNGMFMSPVRNERGEIVYWFASLLDVSHRKAAELALVGAHGRLETRVESAADELRATVAQKTMLLHEVEHRVKNNLQLISSLIQFQARRTADPSVRDALREVQDRVSAVSTVHRRLFQTEDAGRFEVGQFLRDLVDDLLGRSHRHDIQVRFDLESVAAPAAKAAPLALLVNEILAHALRAGFPPSRSGGVTVCLRHLGERFRIVLSDDGAASTADLRDSLAGRTGIVELLTKQLGAEIEWRDNQPGVVALINLPLERGA